VSNIVFQNFESKKIRLYLFERWGILALLVFGALELSVGKKTESAKICGWSV